jgi:hypothetical protein
VTYEPEDLDHLPDRIIRFFQNVNWDLVGWQVTIGLAFVTFAYFYVALIVWIVRGW